MEIPAVLFLHDVSFGFSLFSAIVVCRG